MTIPRENGMIRLYVQLREKTPASLSGQPFSPSHIIMTAQNIIRPYKLDYHHLYWSSCYRVQQKLATRFSAFGRIFLIGDAIHTHSPKAGQGLNVSIQDAYNLGWKLAAVVNGEARPALLSTYEEDRRPIAKFLVDFDESFQRFFHEPLAAMNWSAEDYSAALCEAVNVEHVELSGISACFKDDHMFEDPQYVQQELAPGVLIGRRIPDVLIVNQADGRGWYLHDLLYNNGHWRLLIFAGDLRDETLKRRYIDLGRDLCSIDSPLNAFSSGNKAEALVDVFTIHASPRHDIDLLQLPEVFRPWNDERGWDYHKVFVDDETYHDGRSYVYETFGICPYRGCALLLRPDQHVCMIMDNENAARASTRYLRNWLYERPKPTNGSRN
jgi:phenol 2-monooxygenase